jgi:hypothetical protein
MHPHPKQLNTGSMWWCVLAAAAWLVVSHGETEENRRAETKPHKIFIPPRSVCWMPPAVDPAICPILEQTLPGAHLGDQQRSPSEKITGPGHQGFVS